MKILFISLLLTGCAVKQPPEVEKIKLYQGDCEVIIKIHYKDLKEHLSIDVPQSKECKLK